MKMTNKIFFLFILIFCFGCSSRKKEVFKELKGAEIERISEVKIKSTEIFKKDSVIKKKTDNLKEDRSVDLIVDFDPKKNDSLEVNQVIGKDTLKLKVSGNGKVSLTYKSNTSNSKVESSEIFGSKTLKNIDSIASKKEKEKSKEETLQKKKKQSITIQNSFQDMGMIQFLPGQYFH